MTDKEFRRLSRADLAESICLLQKTSGEPEPDAILRSIEEGRYDGGGEG